MACWIALHLPFLALEIASPRIGTQALDEAQADTTVVLAQSRVWQAGEVAQAAGVQPGMRRGGVLALLPQARFHDRDDAAETVALEALALALLRFGPDVAIAAPQCVVIDVAPSLRLFGGLESLAGQVLESAEALGHRASMGIAGTASAAALFARADGTTPVQLDSLTVALLPEAQPWLDWLAQIGCATLGELRALPSAGVRRRCGAELPASLARAYGETPEAPAWYRAPPHFEAVLPLPSLTHDVDALLFGLRRLLVQLTGWLAAGQLATRALTLILEHEPLGRQTLPPHTF